MLITFVRAFLPSFPAPPLPFAPAVFWCGICVQVALCSSAFRLLNKAAMDNRKKAEQIAEIGGMRELAITNVILIVVLPELVMLGFLAMSTLLSWRDRRLFNSCATAGIFITTFWSLVAWYQIIFLGALQTCRPLVLNAVGVGFFCAQLIAIARHENRTSSTGVLEPEWP